MNPRQFDALMQRYFAEELTAEEEQSLEKALLSDEAARFRFVELSDQEAAIRIVAQGADLAQQYSRVIGGGQGAPKAGRSLRVPARSKWLAAAGAAAAAAVLLTVGAKFLFRDAWPGSSLENNTGSVIRKSLRDGTQLALEPGARLRLQGADQKRRIRQLIRLEEGEITVRAPKAPNGEVACRVETEDGLWVETMGTFFKVARTYENEQKERNVNKSKLAGLVAAVLAVAVIEGEVRTGNAQAAEHRVAAGGKSEVTASKITRVRPDAPPDQATGRDLVAAQAVTILDGANTFVRWISVQRPAVIVGQPGAAERTTFLDRTKIDAKAAGQVTPELPAGWTGAAFDDAAWPRARTSELVTLAFMNGQGGPSGIASDAPTTALFKLGVLALRGKFNVTDPAVARLTLSLKYRGGVVVYLDGREVARGGLPAGALTPGTPGEPYPDEAYVDTKGKVLPRLSEIKKDDHQTRDRIALRDRVLGPVALPADLLRKGLNVLAIELHRSDYNPSAAKFFATQAHDYQDITAGPGWTPCALMDLNLSADGGVDSNAHRPAGVQVWNQDCNDRTLVSDCGDPNEPLRPIVLTGARNGVFSGKVVVSSHQAIEGLLATPGELKTVDGKGVIAATAVDVRYAEPFWQREWQHSEFPEALSATPPAKTLPAATGNGAVEEVWVLVRVPAAATAGDYTGTLAIAAGGQKLADAPLRLHVADWKLPDPKDFHTFVGLYQSPDTLAMKYKVPQWSEKHWALLEKSMDLLGQLGNKLVHVNVVDKTKWGNDDGMVTWIKKDDGSFDYDYSVVERYLRTVRKHMGVPRFVVLNVYNPGGWMPAKPLQENTVTVLDRKTGQREHLQVPEFGTEESKKFWTPVLLGLKERLAKEGMEKSLCVGSLCEALPRPAEATMFAEILGDDVQWFRQGHPGHGNVTDPEPIRNGGHVGVHFFTYLPHLPGPEAGVPSLSTVFWPRTAYFRMVTKVYEPLPCLRSYAATSRFLRMPGFGYSGLDYWSLVNVRSGDGWTNCLWGRWPRTGSYPGALAPQYITAPGPDGAEPLAAFQAIREGLQESEALCFISAALDGNSNALSPELADRCRQVIGDALAYYRDRCGLKWDLPFHHVNHYGWQDLSQRAFTLAGEVSSKAAK